LLEEWAGASVEYILAAKYTLWNSHSAAIRRNEGWKHGIANNHENLYPNLLIIIVYDSVTNTNPFTGKASLQHCKECCAS
jgi:hypothetical protein